MRHCLIAKPYSVKLSYWDPVSSR